MFCQHKPTTIYALVDPRNNEVRYVGKTINPKDRVWDHINAPSKRNTYSSRWIRSIRPHIPEFVELEIVFDEHWIEAEQFWIAYLKSIGARLTNTTAGGEGVLGYKPTTEQNRRNSERQKGRKLNEKWRDNVVKALVGRKLSDETKKKISESLKNIEPDKRARITEGRKKRGGNFREGTKMSEEHKAKLMAINVGSKRSAESRLKMSIAQTGKKQGEEQIRKKSESMKAYWQKRKEQHND